MKIRLMLATMLGALLLSGTIAVRAADKTDDEKKEETLRAPKKEKVTVTATRLPADGQDLSSVPAPVSVYDREDIEASGAQTIQEFFAGHSSFNVYDQVGNSLQSTVALRGFNTSNTPRASRPRRSA